MAIAKKRKKFFDVEIPIINKETQLQAYEIKELDKRLINYFHKKNLKVISINKKVIIVFQTRIEFFRLKSIFL